MNSEPNTTKCGDERALGIMFKRDIDYGPVLLRRPFGFQLTVDTLPSGVQPGVASGRSWLSVRACGPQNLMKISQS